MFSMTGYGRAEGSLDGRELTVEMKAVNHRFLDISVKMPKVFNSCEDALKKVISKFVSRGHIDVYVNYADNGEREKRVEVDAALAKGYVDASIRLQREFGLQNDFTLSALMRLPDVVKVSFLADDEQVLRNFLEDVTTEACVNLNKMRAFEGAKLRADLESRMENVGRMTSEVKKLAPKVAEEYAEKLKIRIAEALGDVQYDEAKFLNEVAFFVDKSNIDEEISRLSGHISHFGEILNGGEQAGRRLDFLVQELNREVNTICSKSNNASLTSIGLELKNEIEKIREQVQNAE